MTRVNFFETVRACNGNNVYLQFENVEEAYIPNLEETKKEIFDKMKALADTLDVIYKHPDIYLYKLAMEDVDRIVCDAQNQYDEFHLFDEEEENYVYIEVVTRDVAISNDLDFMDNAEEIKEYHETGEADCGLSMYTKLGETGYYFRLM